MNKPMMGGADDDSNVTNFTRKPFEAYHHGFAMTYFPCKRFAIFGTNLKSDGFSLISYSS